MTAKQKVLFICTGNSARSQMAEALARHIGKGLVEAHSAGLAPKGLHPLAIIVMDEIGIDIRRQRSKAIDPGLFQQTDVIVTVCSHAESRCPATPPSVPRLHWPIPDPAAAVGSEEDRLTAFRSAREEIKNRLLEWLKASGLSG